MGWISGVRQDGGQQRFVVVTRGGLVETLSVASLTLPESPSSSKPERRVFTGTFSGWERAAADKYLQAFSFEAPQHMVQEHPVYCHQLDDETTLHVPAILFIRALYKPHYLLLPAIYSPVNIDALGFVDYSRTPPAPVVDVDGAICRRNHYSEAQHEPLRWALSSRSARASSQSVYSNSLNGCVDLALPQGQFKLVIHGRRVGAELFATKVTVISVSVEAADSVTGNEQVFLFHRMAGSERTVPSLSALPPVPTRPNGLVTLTDAEWSDVEGVLNIQPRRQQKHSQRELLDVMLHKLSGGSSWKSIARSSGFQETILTTTFRRWQLDGRLAKVLDRLELARPRV